MCKVPLWIFILQYHHSTKNPKLKSSLESNTSKQQASLIISDLKYGLQVLKLEKIRDYGHQILRRRKPPRHHVF